MSRTEKNKARMASAANRVIGLVAGAAFVGLAYCLPPWVHAQGQAQPKAKSAPPAQGAPRVTIKNRDDPRVRAAVTRGVAYLRSAVANSNAGIGELALAVQAMAKANRAYPELVPANDPVFQQALAAVRSICVPQYRGSSGRPLGHGHDLYEAGCAIMALAAADASANSTENVPAIEAVAQHIIASQKTNGPWGYNAKQDTQGDNSITQYAILGLWEASASAGVKIPMEVFDNAAGWIVANQNPDGGHGYHPGGGETQSTHTMTAAALGSVAICRDHLPYGRRRATRIGGVLRRIEDNTERVTYSPRIQLERINRSIDDAKAWIEADFKIELPQWQMYYLYAIERMTTLIQEDLPGNGRVLANLDWYSEIAEWMLARQDQDGSWNKGQGQVLDTSWAILFLVRSTAQSVKTHGEKKLGRATLVSNEGLLTDPRKLEKVGNELKAAALRGDNQKLIEILEKSPDEAAATAEQVFAELFQKKSTSPSEKVELGRQMLDRGYKLKHEALIKQGLRSLAQSGDYRVVPLLIDGLYYEQIPSVMFAARDALRLISRKFTGFEIRGRNNTEEWEQEIANWEAWYRSVRPQAELDDEMALNTAPAAAAATPK